MSALSLATLPQRVKICEMGPRDGLQNEAAIVAPADKIRFIDLLSESGLAVVETTSFVRPNAIPQLTDAEEVMARIERRAGVTYLCLVPNVRGLERARSAGVRAIAVFTAASEAFAQRNINMSIERSLETFRDVVKSARGEGMWVRGYVSTAFGCPYQGAVPVDDVVRVAEALAEMGVDEISIGDTIGVATPNQVIDVAGALQARMPVERIAMHFHDTRGTALANVVAALQMNVAIFDASSGGLGGCPYAPGATGNLATEDLLYMLDGMGIETGVSLEKIRDASRFIAGVLQRDPVSRAYRALEAACARQSARV
ncbi:MAG: hydroxymethylglutaryl-CoA lyase [Candidatus Eremiobacteraeota bacterium]|nr:hydroxymethylglutaryl-CoA lyase [Candidatus Eremiobacteraeota bacterium]